MIANDACTLWDFVVFLQKQVSAKMLTQFVYTIKPTQMMSLIAR
jgi:hypothetical protein